MTDLPDAGLTAADEALLSLDDAPAEQAPDPKPEQNDEDPGDDRAAETEQDEGEGEEAPPPRKPTAQERIDELTRLRRDAERRAEQAERRAHEAEQRQAKPEPKPQADDEPDPANYTYGDTDVAYIRDVTRWEVRQEYAAQQQQHSIRSQAQQIEQAWNAQQAEFAKKSPDYYEALDSTWVCTPVMADAIKTSEEGAAVAYHLAKNPAEAQRIAGLNPLAQVRELGRIEARLATPEPAPTQQPKPASDAPKPFPQVRGAQGRFAPDLEKGSFADFEREADRVLAKKR